MSVLVDTNLLLRLAEPTHSQHKVASEAIAKLFQRNEFLVVVPQNLYEFWVVATRPLDRNGLGFLAVAVEAEVAKIELLFNLIEDESGILSRWKQLVVRFDVRGKPAHDARLVAAMQVHGIGTLITFNKSDFQRYTDITVLTPDEVISM